MKTVLTVSFTVLAVALGVFLLARTIVSVGIVVAAALFAVALDHAVRALVRRGWRRGLAIAAVLLSLVVLLGGLGWLVVPEAVRQVDQLLDRLPAFLDEIRESPVYRTLDARFGIGRILEGRGEAVALPEQAVTTSIAALRQAVIGVVVLVSVAFTVVFMLAFGGNLVEGLLAEAVPAHRARYERFLGKLYDAVGGYIAGLSVLALVNAAINTVVLAIFGLPFFLPLGLVSGLGSFVPFVGAVLAGTMMGVIGLASGGIWTGVGVVAWYLVYQQIENHAIAPLIYRRTVRLNPLVALVAVLFVAEVAGPVGAILAVPIAAVGQILLAEILRFRRERLEVPPGVPVSEALEERDQS